MVNSTLDAELHSYLDNMPSDKQSLVLAYARSLSEQNLQGTPGQSLLKFVGTIEDDDLSVMESIIADGCERVDLQDW